MSTRLIARAQLACNGRYIGSVIDARTRAIVNSKINFRTIGAALAWSRSYIAHIEAPKASPSPDTRSQVDRAISTLSWVRSFLYTVTLARPMLTEALAAEYQSAMRACAEHSRYWAGRVDTQRATLALAS